MSSRSVHAQTVVSPAAVERSSASQANRLAPQIVHQVLQQPGERLEPTARAFFESRFAHDFSRVRIHADSRAAASAEAVGARAYSVGQHLAFAAAQYRPDLPAGRNLLAHELAHVVQQPNVATAAGLEIGAENDPAEQAADRAAATLQRPSRLPSSRPFAMLRRQTPQAATVAATPADRLEFARTALDFLRSQAEYFALATRVDGAVLQRTLDGMKSSVEGVLGMLAGQTTQPTLADDLRAAYASAVRAVLTAHIRSHTSTIHAAPTLRELFEQYRESILAHALPQATIDSAANELSQELEPVGTATTAAERTRRSQVAAARQRLLVLTGAISGVDIDALFSTQGSTMTIPLPAGTVARFSSSIPSALQRGLSNVAGTLARASLVANTTVMLALDLAAFGGGYDSYRFTRLDLGAAGGEILIERLGAIGIEGLRAEARQRLQQRFNRNGFQRSGYRQDEFDQVLIGIGEVPDGILGTLSGLSFARTAVHPTEPAAAGEYDQATHTITMFDTAFSDSITRFGRAGRLLKFAAQAVVHEIGHAADLRTLRQVGTGVDTADAALIAEFGTGGTGYSIPDRRDPARARYNELQGAISTARVAESSARSISGSRWLRPTGGGDTTITEATARREATPAFRAAARRDGGSADRFPTSYPNPDDFWQEYFAESFALYLTSPDTLRRIRPNVFRFFETTFPVTP